MLTTNSMGGNIVSAIVIFTLIFYTRFQLLDNQYKYSFEPDSEACVSVTKSFYNFFKNPCKETIPNTLSSYPPYQDGDFIFGAITANCIRILVNIGCLETNVGDGDNSIIICAMRWNGVFFQCLAGVLVFMIVLILTDCTLASALITVIYFILSPQLLDIDLIRIDYFYFFSAVVLFYASLRLVVQPNKGINYTLAGISTALVVSTKMNFPFYLLPVIASFIYLFIHKKVSTKYVFVFFYLVRYFVHFFISKMVILPRRDTPYRFRNFDYWR